MALSTRSTAVPPAPRVVRNRRALLGSGRRQLVAAVVILGALGFLVAQGLSSATTYFLFTNQAVAQHASLGDKPFRIEGTVSSRPRQAGAFTDFTITSNNVSVAVISSHSPSALFREGIPVVLEGHWNGNVYDSDLIMVKHSASYSAAHPERLRSQVGKAGGS